MFWLDTLNEMVVRSGLASFPGPKRRRRKVLDFGMRLGLATR